MRLIRSTILFAFFLFIGANFSWANLTGALQLTDSTYTDISIYKSGDSVYIQLSDPDLNTDPNTQETFSVNITSDTEDTGTPSSASIALASATNQGNGTIAKVTTSYTTLTEDWRITCVDGYRFSVTASLSGMHRGAQAGGKYTSNNGEVSFSITQGSINFGRGDSFTFTTTAANPVSEPVTLTESQINSGVFRGSIALGSTTAAIDADLDINSGDFLTVIYNDTADDWANPKVLVDTALYSNTVVSGPISEDTLWTQANSPYLITGDVTVNPGVTLTIEPGVKVMFLAKSDDKKSGWNIYRSELIIQGRLIAQGTSANKILFTSSSKNPQTSDWFGIMFFGGQGTIEHCQIEYSSYGIYLQSSSPTITNNILSYNSNALYCTYSSNPSIETNTISNNSVGIFCEQSSPLINNNNISNNARGISCFSWSSNLYSSPSISNNTLSGNDYGIYCYGYSTPAITNNAITNSRYYGIYSDFYDPLADSSQSITHNTITGNRDRGIVLSSYASPAIQQNNLHSNTPYDVANYTPKEIDARYNWWGEVATTQMNAGGNPKNISSIFDYFDNTNYGMVNYSGWLGEEILLAPTALNAIAGNRVAYLSWTPNLGSIGSKVYYGTSSGAYEHSLDAKNIFIDYPLEGLTNNTTYYITVTAYNAKGKESGYSAEIQVTPTLFGGVMGFIFLDKEYYQLLTDSAVITLKDADLNTEPAVIENSDIKVTSSSDTKGITITLTETSADSGIFSSTASGKDLRFTTASSDDVNELLKVSDGDIVTASYKDLTPNLTRTTKAIIDASSPQTTFTPSGNLYYDGKNYYAPLSFTYSFSAVDKYSGVERIEYNIDSSAFVEFINPFTLNSQGPHTISYRSLDKAGNWEEAKTKVIIVDTTAPAAPTGLNISQVNFQTSLRWNRNSEPDLAGYNVYRDGSKLNTSLITRNSYNDLIIGGKTYIYNVTAVDRLGNESPFSASVSISTVSTAAVITYPGNGAFFIESPIVVRGNSEPAAKVEIFVNGLSAGIVLASSSGNFSLSGVNISEGKNTLTAISTNSYGVTAPESSPVSVYLDFKPQPPLAVKAAASDTQITLSWEPNPETDIIGYHIYRDNDNRRLNYNLLTGTQFTDTRLTNARAYTYTITTVDARGSESDKLSKVTATAVAGIEWEIPKGP